MPSLPELEVYKRELELELARVPVARVEALDYRVVRADESEMNRQLTGNEIKEVTRYGKWLIFDFGKSPNLVLHLGLTGKLKLLDEGEKRPRYSCFALVFDGGQMLVMSDFKKLGKVYLRDFEEINTEKSLGPDLFDMSEDDFVKALSRHKRARDGLMDQKRIAGIGGKYADEILWQARLHPNTRLDGLGDPKLRELYRLAMVINETAIELGADVKRFSQLWLIPHRAGDKICPRCGAELTVRNLGGSTVVYCADCQPPPNPYAK